MPSVASHFELRSRSRLLQSAEQSKRLLLENVARGVLSRSLLLQSAERGVFRRRLLLQSAERGVFRRGMRLQSTRFAMTRISMQGVATKCMCVCVVLLLAIWTSGHLEKQAS